LTLAGRLKNRIEGVDMPEGTTDETARAMRQLWFDYLDTIEPARPRLHSYCLKLTGSIFDAEDLLQETLLKGFGSIGRAELPSETFPDARAYLCRIATNAWIDEQRRRGRAEKAVRMMENNEGPREQPPITSAASAVLFERTSPQERAAVVLKDVFDFSLEEIASLLSTSVGAVKSALHRGRERLSDKVEHAPARLKPASVELIDRFIAAFRSRDLTAVTALLLESVTYEVQGVGTEHGRKGHWITINIGNQEIEGVRSERHVLDGELVIAGIYRSSAEEYLASLVRLEESEGKVARVINYFFCPDTLAFAANALGFLPPKRQYHQDSETLARMIGDARLPWHG
jgi:RNA polymerase sigma-70 factor (ECF subfamily)